MRSGPSFPAPAVRTRRFALALLFFLAGPAAGAEAPAILRFAIDDGAAATGSQQVTLHSEVAGAPDSYRASERRDLGDAMWRLYTPAAVFRLRAEGPAQRIIYLQVRRGETVSRVARDGIRFTPRRASVALPLGAARGHAAALGWAFAVEQGNPFSKCDFRAEAGRLVLSARQKKPLFDGICDFVLFGGARVLASGWRFMHFERSRPRFRHCRVRFLEFPVIEGRQIAFRLRIIDARKPVTEKEDPGYRMAGCVYAIESITLEGPAGADWRDAFEP